MTAKQWAQRARLVATEILDGAEPRGGWTAQERKAVGELLEEAWLAGLEVGAGWVSGSASASFMDVADQMTELKKAAA